MSQIKFILFPNDIIVRVFKYKGFKLWYDIFSEPIDLFISAFGILLLSILILGNATSSIIAVFIFLFVWLALTRWFGKQVSKYYVDDLEFTAYYSYFISIALKNREGAKQTIKEDYNKEAINYVRDFLKIIEERWTVGKFKLVRDVYHKPVKDFRLGLRYRVIPSLKGEDEAQLKIIKNVMDTLYEHWNSLQITDIMDFNKSISALPDKQPRLTGSYKKISEYFSGHKNMKVILYLIGAVLGCTIFAYSSVTYFNIPNVYVYASTVVIFLALLEIILHKK